LHYLGAVVALCSVFRCCFNPNKAMKPIKTVFRGKGGFSVDFSICVMLRDLQELLQVTLMGFADVSAVPQKRRRNASARDVAT
jgi:hypothetical protein